MNIIKIFMLAMSLLIVSACSGNNVSNIEEDVIKENTEVSAEESIDLPVTEEYNNKFIEVMSEFNNYIKLSNDKNKTTEDLKDIHKDFILYLNSFSISPTTELEKEADGFIKEMLYHMEQHVNYSLKYVNTKDDVFIDLQSDEYDEILLNVELADEVLSDYGKY